jgi:sulfide:quinone oxidoreductase
VAALEGALALRRLAEERVELVLLAPEAEFRYRPMAVVEPFGVGSPYEFPIAELAADVGAELLHEALVSVDPDRRLASTATGSIAYDSLLLACGAELRPGLEGAYTFGPGDERQLLARVLEEIERGLVRTVAFALPTGPTWALPLYELALLTAHRLAQQQVKGVTLTLVTPEEVPLAIFGREAADTTSRLLTENGIALVTRRHSVSFDSGVLRLAPGDTVEADRVVTLPRLAGTPIGRIPRTAEGFIRTNPHGRVTGLVAVYAAGDITAFPVKQGGIAADQAVAAAQSIAAAAGAPVEPRPFDPVLHGLLLTGSTPRYLRAPLTGGRGEHAEVANEPLWWPPGKIIGRYLPNYLAQRRNLVQ